MAYVDTTPIIPNTTMQQSTYTYFIKPIEGYVLHDNRKDWTDIVDGEEVTFEGFSTYGVTVPLSYDFVTNPFNLYTKLRSEVPENQIFGGNNGNVEVAKTEETEEVM